jgi:hypothetical protein
MIKTYLASWHEELNQSIVISMHGPIEHRVFDTRPYLMHMLVEQVQRL